MNLPLNSLVDHSDATEHARYNMVEQQIRPWNVQHPALLEALHTLRREDFVPPAHYQKAFMDTEIQPTALADILIPHHGDALSFYAHTTVCLFHLIWQAACLDSTSKSCRKAMSSSAISALPASPPKRMADASGTILLMCLTSGLSLKSTTSAT